MGPHSETKISFFILYVLSVLIAIFISKKKDFQNTFHLLLIPLLEVPVWTSGISLLTFGKPGSKGRCTPCQEETLSHLLHKSCVPPASSETLIFISRQILCSSKTLMHSLALDLYLQSNCNSSCVTVKYAINYFRKTLYHTQNRL